MVLRSTLLYTHLYIGDRADPGIAIVQDNILLMVQSVPAVASPNKQMVRHRPRFTFNLILVETFRRKRHPKIGNPSVHHTPGDGTI